MTTAKWKAAESLDRIADAVERIARVLEESRRTSQAEFDVGVALDVLGVVDPLRSDLLHVFANEAARVLEQDRPRVRVPPCEQCGLAHLPDPARVCWRAE